VLSNRRRRYALHCNTRTGIAFAACLGLFCSGCTQDPADARAPAPRLHFDQASLDMGTLLAGESRLITYRYRNTGDATLNVERVRLGCGCGRLISYDAVLGLGESGELTLLFENPAGDTFERKSIPIFLLTNVPVQPTARLTLKVSAVHEFETEPRDKVLLGVISSSKPVTGHFILRKYYDQSRDSEFVIRCSSPRARTAFTELDSSDPRLRCFKVDYTIEPPLDYGLLSETVSVVSPVNEGVYTKLFIEATVGENVEIFPPLLFWLVIDKQHSPRPIQVSISVVEASQETMVQIAHTPQWIRADLVRMADDEWVLKAALDVDRCLDGPTVDDNVLLSCSAFSNEQISIPIKVLVSGDEDGNRRYQQGAEGQKKGHSS